MTICLRCFEDVTAAGKDRGEYPRNWVSRDPFAYGS